MKKITDLSTRIEQLRAVCLSGKTRPWNRAFCVLTTGTPWDEIFDITGYDTFPDMEPYFTAIKKSLQRAAVVVPVPEDFYQLSIAQRRAWLFTTAISEHTPIELLPDDLLCGMPIRLAISSCLSKREAQAQARQLEGKNGLVALAGDFYQRGSGECGGADGYISPDYPSVLIKGFAGIAGEIRIKYNLLNKRDKSGQQGARLKAMLSACAIPRTLARRYAALCGQLAQQASTPSRQSELRIMEENLLRIPEAPAKTFYEAIQSLLLAHLLVLNEAAGTQKTVSLGRIDQYLLPYWNASIRDGMEREFGKELIRCFLLHCSLARDSLPEAIGVDIPAMSRQTYCLGGTNADGTDASNELTTLFLDILEELGPLPGVTPVVLVHKNTPGKLWEQMIDLLASFPDGLPVTLSFEASASTSTPDANFSSEAASAQIEPAPATPGQDASNPDTSIDGCQSHVDCTVNLAKALELTLGGGRELAIPTDDGASKANPLKWSGGKAKDPRTFTSFEQFYDAFLAQCKAIIHQAAGICGQRRLLSETFLPRPYTDTLLHASAELEDTPDAGGAYQKIYGMSAGSFPTAINGLLAVQYLVFDRQLCDLDTLLAALSTNWSGYEVLFAAAKHRAPKFGYDDPASTGLAFRLAQDVAKLIRQGGDSHGDVRFFPVMLDLGTESRSYAHDDQPLHPSLRNALFALSDKSMDCPTALVNSIGAAMEGWNGGGKALPKPGFVHRLVAISDNFLQGVEQRGRLKAFLHGCAHHDGLSLRFLVSGIARESNKPNPPAPLENENLSEKRKETV